MEAVFRILFYTPEIPGNTGNAIRLAAVTGAELHLVEPLGFTFEDAKLRRAGLDYHDLAVVHVHKTLEDAWQALQPGNVYAFTAEGDRSYTDISYAPGDVLLFGPESVGLPEEVKQDRHVTARVRLPSTCFRAGDYGAVRTRIITEIGSDADVAPERRGGSDGGLHWARSAWTARG